MARGTTIRARFGLAAIAFALAATGRAQTSRGALSGTITDSSGAVIAGAGIALIHTQNGVRRSTVSNEAGIYRFDVEVPERDVVGAPAGRFLNRDFTNSGIRSLWVQVKVTF